MILSALFFGAALVIGLCLGVVIVASLKEVSR